MGYLDLQDISTKVIKQLKSDADKAVDDLYSLTYDDISLPWRRLYECRRITGPLDKNGTNCMTVDGSNLRL